MVANGFLAFEREVQSNETTAIHDRYDYKAQLDVTNSLVHEATEAKLILTIVNKLCNQNFCPSGYHLGLI